MILGKEGSSRAYYPTRQVSVTLPYNWEGQASLSSTTSFNDQLQGTTLHAGHKNNRHTSKGGHSVTLRLPVTQTGHVGWEPSIHLIFAWGRR